MTPTPAPRTSRTPRPGARTPRHLAGARILAQGLAAGAETRPPAEVVRSFGAMQGQDLPGVLASLALRSTGGLEAVLAAVDRGEIVRGYPMRGTVFAVEAGSLAWMTQLCADGPVRAAIARRRQLGLEEHHAQRAFEELHEAAEQVSAPGGPGILRAELMRRWEEAGVPTEGGRGHHLLTYLISTGHAAYGPWREGEMAVVLAERWLPPGRDIEGAFGGDRIAAVAELARRYVLSHGPASERDLAWWSKLPLGQIRAALPLIQGELDSGWADRRGALHAREEEARGGAGEQLYWRPGLAEDYAAQQKAAMRELLLPGFDELVLGYRDRLFLMDEERHRRLVPGGNGVFKRGALRRGELVGLWSRTGPAGRRRFVLDELAPVSPAQRSRFEKQFTRFPFATP